MDAIPDLELEQIPAWLFATLADGAARRQAAMHVLTLATIENAEPRQRTMVLRGASAAEGWLQFHTDRRKSLLDALKHGASLSWYSRGLKLQWRARVHLQDMTGTVVEDTAWARTRDLSRRCYRQSLPPGTPVEKAGESGPPVGEGRENFTVLRAHLQHIDWLFLSIAGHQRAEFIREESGWRGRWLAP